MNGTATATSMRAAALTPERLAAAHQAGMLATEPYRRQMERVVAYATYTAIIAPTGEIIRSSYDDETERLLSELRASAAEAYSAAVEVALRGLATNGI